MGTDPVFTLIGLLGFIVLIVLTIRSGSGPG